MLPLGIQSHYLTYSNFRCTVIVFRVFSCSCAGTQTHPHEKSLARCRLKQRDAHSQGKRREHPNFDRHCPVIRRLHRHECHHRRRTGHDRGHQSVHESNPRHPEEIHSQHVQPDRVRKEVDVQRGWNLHIVHAGRRKGVVAAADRLWQ